MHTVCYEVFYFRQSVELCYEVFERNDIIETTAQHEFKSERNLKNLTCNDLLPTKKRFKMKSILLFLSPLSK